jgi:uncharacterized protein (DUF2141 family)
MWSIGISCTVFNSIAGNTATSFSGLSAGNYRVLATQSSNGEVGTQQVDVVIVNLIETLDFILKIDGNRL